MSNSTSTIGRLHQPSGSLGSAAFVAPAISIVLAAILAIVYAYVLVYIPIGGYVSLFIVIGYAFALGMSVAWACKLSKCRSPKFVGTLGLIIGLLGFYLSWAAFEYVLFQRWDEAGEASLTALMLSPRAIWGLASAINEEGWYSIRDWTPSGIVLWLFWAIEAVIVVLGSMLIASGSAEDDVFCENCDAWCDREPTKDSNRLQLPDPTALGRMKAGDINTLSQLAAAVDADQNYLRVRSWACGNCRRTAVIQVEEVTLSVDSKGKTSEKTQKVTDKRLATPEFIRSLGKASVETGG